jgi:hypothetical protein
MLQNSYYRPGSATHSALSPTHSPVNKGEKEEIGYITESSYPSSNLELRNSRRNMRNFFLVTQIFKGTIRTIIQ